MSSRVLEASSYLKDTCTMDSKVTTIKYVGKHYAKNIKDVCGGDTLQHLVNHFEHLNEDQRHWDIVRCATNERMGKEVNGKIIQQFNPKVEQNIKLFLNDFFKDSL